MVTTAVSMLKIVAMATATVTALTALVVIFELAFYGLLGFNQGIWSDLIGLMQIWLPFNINEVLAWLLTGSTAYFAYRLAVMIKNSIQSVLRG